MGSREYWLYMREDTNTHGLRQWFFFEVRLIVRVGSVEKEGTLPVQNIQVF